MKTSLARLALTALAGAALSTLPLGAHAGGFEFVGTPSSPNSVTLNAGQTFSFSVFLTADQPVTGVSYFLSAADPGAGLFKLVGRSLGDSPFTDLNTTNAAALQSSEALLNPQNFADLGGTISDVTTPLGAGTYRVSTVTLQALSGIAPGVYTIQSSPDSTAIDADFNNVETGAGSFEVNVVTYPVPETSTMVSFGALLALGLGGTFLRRRRYA